MTTMAVALVARAKERVVRDVAPPMWRGFVLPFQVFAQMRRDPVARRVYWQTVLPQLLVIAVALLIFWPKSLDLLWFSETVAHSEDGFRIRDQGWFLNVLPAQRIHVALASLYATLCAIEWTVLFLWKEHNDRLQHELSLVAGVPADEAPEHPRVRADVGALKRKLWRQASGFVLFAFPAPFLLLVQWIPLAGRPIQHALVFGWSIYWAAVLCAGKSHLAWHRGEGAVPFAPWYLRTWNALGARLPVLRLAAPTKYGRLWTKLSSKVAGPEEMLERAPREFSGLFFARMIAAIPVVSIFLRPLIPVASTKLVIDARGKTTATLYCARKRLAQQS